MAWESGSSAATSGDPGANCARFASAGGVPLSDFHGWPPASSSPDASLPACGIRRDVAETRRTTGAVPGPQDVVVHGPTTGSLRSAGAPQGGLSNVPSAARAAVAGLKGENNGTYSLTSGLVEVARPSGRDVRLPRTNSVTLGAAHAGRWSTLCRRPPSPSVSFNGIKGHTSTGRPHRPYL